MTRPAPFGTDTRAKRAYAALLDRAPERVEPALRRLGLRARLGLAAGRRGRRRLLRRLDRWLPKRVTTSPRWRKALAVAVPPGEGPVLLVDARGHRSTDVAARLAWRDQRMVVAVDDPDLEPLRATKLVYELIPKPATTGRGPAPPGWVARRAAIVLDHAIDREVRLEDIDLS